MHVKRFLSVSLFERLCAVVTEQVHHMSLMRYLEMLKSAEFRDDLDVVSTIHTPKGQCAVCSTGLRLMSWLKKIDSVCQDLIKFCNNVKSC